MTVPIRFRRSNSKVTRLSSSLSSLTFAQARIPYVGIPSCAAMLKYAIKEVAKETRPSPAGSKIRDTYRIVIRGKITFAARRIVFIRKLRRIDGCFCMVGLLPFFSLSLCTGNCPVSAFLSVRKTALFQPFPLYGKLRFFSLSLCTENCPFFTGLYSFWPFL